MGCRGVIYMSSSFSLIHDYFYCHCLHAGVPVVDVRWRDVICACEPPTKKSKSLLPGTASESSDAGQGALFVLHYMQRTPDSHKLRCKSITLEAVQGTAERWISQIEEKCKEGGVMLLQSNTLKAKKKLFVSGNMAKFILG